MVTSGLGESEAPPPPPARVPDPQWVRLCQTDPAAPRLRGSPARRTLRNRPRPSPERRARLCSQVPEYHAVAVRCPRPARAWPRSPPHVCRA